ncbi:MAG: cyclase family protein [Halanaerobiales bacterium]|nr:cyclase family protein [Halanaerobiales bacterium]
MNNKFYDISLNIEEGMLSFPGDTIPKFNRIKNIIDDNYNLSNMKVSVHVGTHVDAPSHFIKNGKTIEEISPERFLGDVQVIEIKNKKEIRKRELEKIEFYSNKILFKTQNSNMISENTFQDNFVYLNYEGAEYLIESGIEFIGIDYLTIESLDTTDFSVHKLLLKNNVIVLEGINLKEIKPGNYKLIAPPLKIKGAEASPVRALLYR